MTGNELIAEVLFRLPKPYNEVFTHTSLKLVFRIAFQVIQEATSVGEPVKLRGFGKFDTRSRKGHKVYCGLTKEYVQAKQHIRVIFKPSKKWREALNAVSGRER